MINIIELALDGPDEPESEICLDCNMVVPATGKCDCNE